MMRKIISFAAAALLLSGCGGTEGIRGGAVQLPSHVRKIAVRPFANRTQFFGLEDKLRLRVEEEFIRDGRLPYVNDESQADGVVEGEIANYIKSPIAFDSNQVEEEFKLWILINLRFIDRVNNTVLWEEPRLEQEYHYLVATKPGGLTEEEARQILWDLFARDIVKRTIDGFGSVSGASERKAPTGTLPLPGDKSAPLPPDAPPERRKAPPPP